jgi:hypothetical protein
MKDIPTPEHDALFVKCNEKPLLDELCMVYELAQSLEKRLAIAVAENARLKAAMDKYSEVEILCKYAFEIGLPPHACTTCIYYPDEIEAKAQIEEKK